jgi:hypothetical protein
MASIIEVGGRPALAKEVTGQTVLPMFGEVTNLGDGIEPPESADLDRRQRARQR